VTQPGTAGLDTLTVQLPQPVRECQTKARAAFGTGEVGVHPGRDEPWRDRDRRETLALALALPPDVTLVNWRTLA